LLDRPRIAGREKRPRACILLSEDQDFKRDVHSTNL
jgi:hypothetical protein